MDSSSKVLIMELDLYGVVVHIISRNEIPSAIYLEDELHIIEPDENKMVVVAHVAKDLLNLISDFFMRQDKAYSISKIAVDPL